MRLTLTASEMAKIDLMMMQEFEPEVAQWRWFFGDGVDLMLMISTSDNCRQIAAGMIG